MTWGPLVLAAIIVAVVTGNPYAVALVPFLAVVLAFVDSILTTPTPKEGNPDD